MKPQEIDPRKLKANKFNSNRVSPENMEKLKNSIKELGFAGAVVVRELSDGSLEILGGHHRVVAAIELGLKTVPVVNIGFADEAKARKIALVDNHRFGNDDVMRLADIYKEIGEGVDFLTNILPVSQADIEAIIGASNIDLDSFDIEIDEPEEADPDEERAPKERPLKTHEIMKFRMKLSDADRLRQLIEKTIKEESLVDGDDMTNAGEALAMLVLGGRS